VTNYVVLLKLEQPKDSYTVKGTSLATGPEQAIKGVVADQPGTFVAVPVRNWSEITRAEEVRPPVLRTEEIQPSWIPAAEIGPVAVPEPMPAGEDGEPAEFVEPPPTGNVSSGGRRG
jgi:hypothetical protein